MILILSYGNLFKLLGLRQELTYPPNSEWAKMSLPTAPGDNAQWAFKDLVEVPENIEPGDYILSFRWDSQRTPQVWNSCANIRIV